MAFRSIGDIKSIMKWHLYYEAVMLKTKELGGVGCIELLDVILPAMRTSIQPPTKVN